MKISKELLLEIMYFINDWLRLMGGGREYARLSRLVWNLFKSGVFKDIDLDKFYTLNRVIENYLHFERIERGK